MLEAARAGSSYADVEAAGLAAVAPSEVIPGVRELVDHVSTRGARSATGRGSIVLVDPLGRGEPMPTDGPGRDRRRDRAAVAAADGRERRELEVPNTSRRVVRISSHFPFDRVNARLEFDRDGGARLPPGPRGRLVRALGARRDAHA